MEGIKFVIYLSLICLVCPISAEADAQQPKVVPEGWAAQYDFESRIVDYLKAEHDYAKDRGKTAYIYVYKDGDPHCESIRRFMKRKSVKKAYKGTHMVMLDIDELLRVYKANPKSNFEPPNWYPAIVKISELGKPTSAAIFPDVIVFHPESSQIESHGDATTAAGVFNQSSKRRYVRAMKKFFNENNYTFIEE